MVVFDSRDQCASNKSKIRFAHPSSRMHAGHLGKIMKSQFLQLYYNIYLIELDTPPQLSTTFGLEVANGSQISWYLWKDELNTSVMRI